MNKVLYCVYLEDSKTPMATFIRESWAIEWQKEMQRKTTAGTLYLREIKEKIKCNCILEDGIHDWFCNIEIEKRNLEGLN